MITFYNSLAAQYDLIFADWSESIERQARIVSALLQEEFPKRQLKILDCACGIGTQALGLARMGYQVVASDLSGPSIARAKHEAALRNLSIAFHVSDMTSLVEVPERDFDVVVALDNALPHLSSDQLASALAAMSKKLVSGGLFIASIRDYDAAIFQRPAMEQPAFYGEEGNRRIVHQVWDWKSNSEYTLHLFLTIQSDSEWVTHHFVGSYRCLLRDELSGALISAGFHDVRWQMPEQTGFYQPMVLAQRLRR